MELYPPLPLRAFLTLCVNHACPWPIFNISTSSCEARCCRPFVVTRSQMGQFPRKAKCKIISPYLSLTFFITYCAYPSLPLFDTVIGLNKQIDCEYLMSTRSTCVFCFRCLEAHDSRPEGLLLCKVYTPAAINKAWLFVLLKRVSEKKSRRLHVPVIIVRRRDLDKLMVSPRVTNVHAFRGTRGSLQRGLARHCCCVALSQATSVQLTS